MTEMTEAWATKTRGILVETVNMQKNEAAQEAKGNVLKPYWRSIHDQEFTLVIQNENFEISQNLAYM